MANMSNSDYKSYYDYEYISVGHNRRNILYYYFNMNKFISSENVIASYEYEEKSLKIMNKEIKNINKYCQEMGYIFIGRKLRARWTPELAQDIKAYHP